MLQDQKLQQAYDDYIINYSIEKGLEVTSVKFPFHEDKFLREIA